MAKEDYYAQLGVDRTAETDAIKRAYRKLRISSQAELFAPRSTTGQR